MFAYIVGQGGSVIIFFVCCHIQVPIQRGHRVMLVERKELFQDLGHQVIVRIRLFDPVILFRLLEKVPVVDMAIVGEVDICLPIPMRRIIYDCSTQQRVYNHLRITVRIN